MRIGAKKKPFYRVVVLDERAKRTGAYIELLGTYNPLTEPKDIKLKQDRIDHWVKQGAQFSTGFLRIIGKAPQRPPRKPKKEKQVKEVTTPQETKAEEPAKPEGPQASTMPAEESAKPNKSEESAKSEGSKAIEKAENTPEPVKQEGSNETGETMDNSAEKAESNEVGMNEAVQNKKR